MIRLDGGRIEELQAPVDTIERRVDTDVEIGSFGRRHEELARQHYRHVARAVSEELEAWRATAVVLSGQDDSVSQLERYLTDHVASLVKGRLRLPVAGATADLAREAIEVVGAAEKARRHELVREVRGRAAEGAGAVVGLGPVMEALGTGRVGTLVVEEGFDAPGIRCPDCGRLAPDGSSCPRCGGSPTAVEHLVDTAVNEAFAHHVTVEFLEPSELDGLGHIGALER
jgi:peptide subunit release factor 1 (eRF1)